jgi:hypothetical protein
MKKKPNETIVKAVVAEKTGTDRPPVDFTKEWTNGHKFFSSTQSIAFVELLHTEERTRERHELLKNELSRPRNPLNGDPTPRDSHGEAVMNPKKLNTVTVNRIPLFDSKHDFEQSQSITSKFVRKEPQGKIGVSEEQYKILGNTLAEGWLFLSRFSVCIHFLTSFLHFIRHAISI